jgi:hypothetical protein
LLVQDTCNSKLHCMYSQTASETVNAMVHQQATLHR